MTRFTELRFDDLTVGPVGAVVQELSPDMIARWRALIGYPPEEAPPCSLALTWLLDALRRALHGIPAGGVLMRHELLFAGRPAPHSTISTRVAVAERVERRGRPIVVFQLNSTGPEGGVVGNRMHLIWPSSGPAATRRSGAPAASLDPQEVLLRGSLSQQDIDAYAELSGDYNPLHVDAEAGRRSPFGSTIAHGPLPLGFVQRAIERRLGSEWPSGLRLDARFVGPTRPGDTFAVHLTPESSYQLVDGSGRLLIDVHAQREV
jgi:acyl dehydratase